MKKTNLLLVCLAIALSSVVFWACQKSENTQPSNPVIGNSANAKITVKVGILYFADYAELSKTYNYLRSHQEELGNFASKLKGFQSFNSKFESIDGSKFTKPEDLDQYSKVAFWNTDQGESILDRLLNHPIYAELFNHEGVLVMGSKVVKIGSDRKWYIFDLEYLANNNVLDRIPNVQILEVPIQSSGSRATCASMFCYGSYYKERVNGYKEAEYNLVPTTQGYNIVQFTGSTIMATRSYSRGFLGYWYTSNAKKIEIINQSTGVVLNTQTKKSEIFWVFEGSINSFTSAHKVTQDCGNQTCTN